MDIWEIFSKEDLDEALNMRWISKRDQGELSILNYTDRAQYQPESWNNPAVFNSRGLIVQGDRVIARAFPKFFNWNQSQVEVDLDAPAICYDKVDGSLIIMYVGHTIQTATRGSFVSTQAAKAQEMLPQYLNDTPEVRAIMEEITPLAEIVYPENRIVVDYGREEYMTLLGGIKIKDGSFVAANEFLPQWNGPRILAGAPKSVNEALEDVRPNAEGYVCHVGNTMVKVKQEDYVEKHRARYGLNELRIWEALMRNESFDDFVAGLDDEFYPWISKTWTKFVDAIDEQRKEIEKKFESIEKDTESPTFRRDFALATQGDEYQKYYWSLIDGKSIDTMLLKQMRPVDGGERAYVLEEE